MSSVTSAVDQASATGGVVADSNSLYAGIARSGIRALALYFSRPIRLFRPSKARQVPESVGALMISLTFLMCSQWLDDLEIRCPKRWCGSLASVHIAICQTARCMSVCILCCRALILIRGWLGIQFGVLPRHFVPPLLINTVLGTLLFTSYTTMSSELSSRYPTYSSTCEPSLVSCLLIILLMTCICSVVAAVSGASAGAIQAIAGAPAENVRLLMENGTFHAQTSVSGWRHAWKEVFVDANQPAALKDKLPVRMRLSDAREARLFANELREMAGRGMLVMLNFSYSLPKLDCRLERLGMGTCERRLW